MYLDGVIFRPHRGRRTTAVSKDFVLERGEIFFEYPETGIGTGPGKILMGDGVTKYSDLPYFSEDAGNIKADKVQDAIAGHLAGLDETGNLTDAGIGPDNLLTKVSGAVPGNLASFDPQGNIADSGVPYRTVQRKADKVENPMMGALTKLDNAGNLVDTKIPATTVSDNKEALATLFNYYSAKNILPFPYYMDSTTADGVTFTLHDQLLEVNGTVDPLAENDPDFSFAFMFHPPKGKYAFSGYKDGDTESPLSDNLFIQADVYYNDDIVREPDAVVIDNGSGGVFEAPNDTTYVNIFLHTTKGVTYDRVLIYPMIRLYGTHDTVRVDYVHTNKELTELKQYKKLSEAINVDGTNKHTVESALSAINDLAASVKTVVGALNDLDTETKTSIVAAINEIYSGLTNKTLESLIDVNLTSPVNEQALVYDEASQKWINATAIPSIATVDSVGTVKPDGDTITIDVDGTIHGAAAPYIPSNTEPSDHRPFWVDTSMGGVLKYWNGSTYKAIRFVWD